MEPRNLQRVTGWSCCNMMRRAEWRVKAHLCAQIHLFSLLCEILDHWSLKQSFTVLLVLCQKNKSISWDMTKQTTHFECWMTVFGFLLCLFELFHILCCYHWFLSNWFAQFHSYTFDPLFTRRHMYSTHCSCSCHVWHFLDCLKAPVCSSCASLAHCFRKIVACFNQIIFILDINSFGPSPSESL